MRDYSRNAFAFDYGGFLIPHHNHGIGKIQKGDRHVGLATK
jgi:hypothetical protein